jgi:hypothetical protein
MEAMHCKVYGFFSIQLMVDDTSSADRELYF